MQTEPIMLKSANGFTIELKRGFIINQQVDIIVNITTPDINLETSPLNECFKAGVIGKNTLDRLKVECKSKAPEDLEIGEYVVTGYGKSSSEKYIYHGCLLNDQCKTDLQGYLDFVKECIETANCMGYNTLAVPMLDRTVFTQKAIDNDNDLACYIVDEYISFLDNDVDLKNMHIILVVMGDTLLKIYTNAINIRNEHNDNIRTLLKTDDIAAPKPSTSTSSAPSSPVHGSPYKYDDDSWEDLTKSFNPSGGAIPKHRPKSTNSIGRGSHKALSYTNNNTTKPLDPLGGAKHKHVQNPRTGVRVQSPSTGVSIGRDSKIVLPDIESTPTFQSRNTGDNRRLSASSNGHENDFVIKVYQGDITKADVDTVVHGASSITRDINLAGAVGNALKKAGGWQFEQDCKNLGGSTDKVFVVTDAGTMNYAKIIHINTSKCYVDNDWRGIIKTCIEEANKRQLKSIAFPALGAIKVGSHAQATNFKAVLDGYRTTKPVYLEEVHLVIHDDKLYDTYTRVILESTPDQTGTNYPRDGSTRSSRGQAASKTSQANSSKPFSKKYQGVNIEVTDGDITSENVECIVHGYTVVANMYKGITLDDPVGKAIKQRAGDKFKEECKRTQLTMGQIEVTKGGDLCKQVIHADILIYSSDREPNWTTFVRRCLDKAKDTKIKSIAFPLIKSRMGKIKDLAVLQIAGIKDSLEDKVGSLETVRFVMYNNAEAFKHFNEAAHNLFGLHHGSALKGTTGPSPTSRTNTPQGQVLFATGNINSICIEVVEGDITQDNSEMIVHGTSNTAKGVAFMGNIGSALLYAGGSEFIRECNSKYIPVRSTMITKGGNLKCRNVLHIDISNIKKEDKKEWKEVMRKVMTESYFHKIMSVGFPAIGMGNTTPNQKESIITAFKDAINEYDIKLYKYPKKIRFVTFKDAGLFTILKEVLLSTTTCKTHTTKGRQTSQQITKHKLDINGQIDMEIVKGDITKENTDAIVHVTDSSIRFIGQSGEAIKKAGGKKLVDACLAGAMKCEPRDVVKCFKFAIEEYIKKTRPSLNAVRIVILDDNIFKDLTKIIKTL